MRDDVANIVGDADSGNVDDDVALRLSQLLDDFDCDHDCFY